MKIVPIILFSLFTITLLSCKKDSTSVTKNTAIACQLSNKIETTSDYSDTSYYTYNLLSKVIEISYHHSSYRDSIIYNLSGNISSINNYQNGVLKRTTNYYYSGLNLTHIYTPEIESISLNYPADCFLPDSIFLSSSYNVSIDFNVRSISNIVWSNGNVVSATFNYDNGNIWEVSVISDNKRKLKRFDIPFSWSLVDLLHYFNKNNIISISLVNEETDEMNIFPAGTKILDKIFTYTTNNEVNTIFEPSYYFNFQERNTTCTYNCQ